MSTYLIDRYNIPVRHHVVLMIPVPGNPVRSFELISLGVYSDKTVSNLLDAIQRHEKWLTNGGPLRNAGKWTIKRNGVRFENDCFLVWGSPTNRENNYFVV